MSFLSLDTIDTESAIEVAETFVEATEEFTSKPVEDQLAIIKNALLHFWPQLLTAFIIFVVGLICIKLIKRGLRTVFTRSKLDPALHNFVLSMINVLLNSFLFILVLSSIVPKIGASLVALLGVMGLAVSLAVKDSLANIAGGIALLFTRPFSLGDHVQIDSSEGIIQEIRLNYTVLKTFDNKVIHIPNGDVSKAKIINVTLEPIRRLDIDLSIHVCSDFELAKQLILSAVEKHPLALADPAPIVRMVDQGPSAIVIGCRIWCNTADHFSLKCDLLEEITHQFSAQGIAFPAAKLDVQLSDT